MKKRILVIGSEGQLASELKDISQLQTEFDFIFTQQEEINLKDKFFTSKLESLRPDIIINTAAYTQVDKAETDIKNATLLNTIAPAKLSQLCHKLSIPLFHISSDYVYNVNEGYPLTEVSKTNPKSVYGITKLYGEKLVLDNHDKVIIIRTSWLYSTSGNNFVKTMLRLSKEKKELKIVNDQFGAPTYVADLANVIYTICHKIAKEKNNNYWGIYNYANEGVTSWYDFTNEIFRLKNIEITTIPINSLQYYAVAPRPFWSVMSMNKIKSTFNIHIPHWNEAIKRCLIRI